MAAPCPCFYSVLMLVLCACFPPSCADRRFSDLKRCADEDCSMLLCRGKAAKDFTGPDCRFLSFKKGETIYVYYKLSGQTSDLWAASVGNNFGYFPKDYLIINHIYSEKELEVPTEETDFVCFETGLDQFESYDIDVLLGSTLLLENENSTEESKEPAQDEDASQMTTTESVEPPESKSVDSESESLLDSESVDSESFHEFEPEDSESTLLLESHSVDSEPTLIFDTESVDSESFHESESVDSESTSIPESQSVDSESKSLLESNSVESDSLLELKSVDSESTSLLESKSVDSESTLFLGSKSVDSKLKSLNESESIEPESTLLFESDSVDLESKSLLESNSVESESLHEPQSIDSESTSILESESVDSESKSLLESNSVDSESESLHESKSVNSESTLLLESKADDSESVEAPEIETLQKSTEDDSDGFQPEIDVSSEPASEFKDAQTEETEGISISQDAEVISEDAKPDLLDPDAQDIDYSELLHNQSDSDFEPLETQTAGLDEVHEEAAKTGLSDKDIPLQTPEKTLEDEDRSGFKDAFKTDHEGVTQANESLQELTEEVEEQAGLEGTRAQSDFEELADADEAVDVKIPESSPNAKTASDMSQDVPSEPALETESAKALNISEITKEDNQEELDVVDVLQKAILSQNENANDPQDAVTKNSEKVSESNGRDEKLKEELVTESSETLPPIAQIDEQIDNVKNELLDLLKNTLEDDLNEELLEDENALLSSKAQLTEDIHELEENQQPEGDQWVESQQSANITKQDESGEIHLPPEEPEYSDDVLRLTILRDHLKDEEMEHMQKYLELKNLFKIEAMFSDLDLEMKSARELQTDTEEIERTLDQIMEVSENSILDATEDIFKERDQENQEHGQQKEPETYDVEAAILDAFQEIIFSLRQKYSAASDSAPLVEEEHLASETDETMDSEEVNGLDRNLKMTEPHQSPAMHEEPNESEVILNPELNVNRDLSHSKDVGLQEDGGHFNRNQDVQTEIQKGPRAILENPVDMGFHFEVDPSSGSLESPSVSDFGDTEASGVSSSSSTADELWASVLLIKEYLGVYGEILIRALPEESTVLGVPWEPLVVTAVCGTFTVLMFFWRTLLAIKGRSYQLSEKQLREKIQQLLKEKSEAVNQISELKDMIKEREERLKNSEKSLSSSQHEMKALKNRHQMLQRQWEQMCASISPLNQNIADTQEENANLREKIVRMHQRIEKYQKTLKSFDEERAQVHVLMDEARLREDAFKAQVLSFEKENDALKEKKKSLLRDAEDWQEKHRRLSEEIRVYHTSQKELEDSLVHREKEIDVLSSCIAELSRLGACDPAELQKDDAEKTMDGMRLRIKQMMDVSRIKVTLRVVEDERNRFVESLLAEQKARRDLEERYQKAMHEQMNLHKEKAHLENQLKTLQQRLEITTELYQQKEHALQQKLTQEELERREKETKLSEVDSKALLSDEELRALKQKMKDIEEEMQQNERSLKAEVSIQEKKAHENWLKARASERTLLEERRESAVLHQKLVEYRDKISELEQSLFKLSSGAPERHTRRGDSFGPSPVSGGAPSPPQMIEGPGRPPSAPAGRRGEPFGPRPLSDPHGRFSDLGHPLSSRPDMFPPMTSSPCAHDGPMLSKSQSQGSFLPSPVPPPKSYGPPVVPLPPMMIRPPSDLLPEPRFRPPPLDSYGPPPPLGPFGPVPPPFGRGPLLGSLPPPPLGPRDVPPEFFPPRPFPPGAVIPPLYGGRGFPGPPPLTPQRSRDGEGNVTPADEPPTHTSHQNEEP
ncbi:transport and Golgi organization protein 1 homolog [Carassius auratus]|uniref:Transport and Golgi organization protein 1 homolog n=1 Tax=Carassius auratus TaxID=7957 RepID=A0A6P6MKY2_CARAU|nr:transport and Golgi organization protein 1 homolog [Carassius auratus]